MSPLQLHGWESKLSINQYLALERTDFSEMTFSCLHYCHWKSSRERHYWPFVEVLAAVPYVFCLISIIFHPWVESLKPGHISVCVCVCLCMASQSTSPSHFDFLMCLHFSPLPVVFQVFLFHSALLAKYVISLLTSPCHLFSPSSLLSLNTF